MQDVIRDVPRFGSYPHLLSHAASSAASLSSLTEFAEIAVITTIRLLSLRKRNQLYLSKTEQFVNEKRPRLKMSGFCFIKITVFINKTHYFFKKVLTSAIICGIIYNV